MSATPSDPTDPTPALFAAALDYAAPFQHSRACCHVTVSLEDGSTVLDAKVAPHVVVLTPAANSPIPEHIEERQPPAAAAPPVLNEMEENILEAIGDETLTGQQIAERAGYPFDGDLRVCLAAMRRRGLLAGKKGQPGYSVVPTYRRRPCSADAVLTEREANILQAIAEMGARPAGDKIAVRAGYENESDIRKALATLRRRGFLGGNKGDAGYPLTNAGREALDSFNESEEETTRHDARSENDRSS